MALYSAVPPPPEHTTNVASTPPPATPVVNSPSTPVTNGAIDIEAWTISALQSLSVSPIARGTGSPLAINIDQEVKVKVKVKVKESAAVVDGKSGDDKLSPLRRPPSTRDSMRKRDAALKGKEGSRQRRRWENGMPPHLSLRVR